MKKIITIFLSGMLFLTSTSYAEVGVNVGVSGSVGLFGATAKESHGDATPSRAAGSNVYEDTEIAAAAYASLFIEKELGLISIGLDYVPTAFESETVESARHDKQTAASETVTTTENRVQVDLQDLTTLYVALNVTENAYVKAGLMHIDVITNKSLGTGGSYGNTSLDGTLIGFGYNKDLDNGLFIRGEGSYMNFDGASLTSGDMTVTLKNLDGVTGKISIGKSF